MVGLREVPRTATFAWSPSTSSTLLATGTRAGAVDADFSNETQLELWDLDLSNTKKGIELQPSASIDTDSRFHDIAWVQPKDGFSRGVIAGALENGSLDLWDAEKLLNGNGDPFVSRTTTHTGAIKTLQFNPFRSELLATAGSQGEIFISDINNIANPFRLGTGRLNTAGRADDFECLDWNKKVPHIMVTGSSRGSVTVWDVKTKKESLTLKDLGRKPVAALAWDPEKPTRLITAVALDADSLIQVWDLRNSSAPERILKGHEGDVLSLSWCRQDSDLLLSCGKDNRTICWNPQTGDAYGEFPIVENWTFQTKWNPHNPNIFATASFDGKIAVQTIQNTNSGNDHNVGNQSQALDGEEFFNKAQSQLPSASFTLPKAPKWLQRPCGASFGFGGKVLSFTLGEPNGTSSRNSIVRLSNFVVDTEIGAMTDAFEKAMSDHDLKNICETRIAQSTLEAEKTDWKIIETLISDNPRKELVNFLGFSKKDNEAADKPSKANTNGDAGKRLSTRDADGAKNNRLSAFFDNSHEGDSFLADLAATKGAKTNNPFHIYSGSESDSDREITHALMLGQFSKAMEVCLQEDRMSDAFMIAVCGGQQCIDQVQKAYFTKQADGPNYLRLLASVVGKNLWDIVYNADLENWREVMATLCTYANAEEFPDLCEALGDRLEERLNHTSNKSESRMDATFCYIAGSKLEKVVGLWIAQLEQCESSELQDENQDSSFSNHARSLQSFIEKVTVFREVTHYQDDDRNATSDWKLASLYDKYTEYADIAASHGLLQIAEKYLDLLPKQYPVAEVARNRVKQAIRKPATAAAARQSVNVPTNTTMNVTATSNRTSKSIPTFEDQRQPAKSSVPSTSMYTPQGVSQPEGAYAPQSHGSHGSQGYQPTQQPQQGQRQQYGIAPPHTYGALPPSNHSLGPPPRTFNSSPSIAPPSKDKNMSNWNDTPEDFFKPPTSRRSTPSVVAPPMVAPFANQPIMPTPPMAGQAFGAQPRSTPPAPPPKGPAPPPRSMTPQTNGPYSYQQPERPPSSTANIYAPQQSSNQLGPGQQHPPVPRGPSPYNAPPSGPPPPNRYTPAPAAQAPAPVVKRPAPPPNPYASQQNLPTRQSFPTEQYGSQETPLQQPAPPPNASTTPAGHSEASRPGTAQSQKGRASVPATPKYPPGDRSHIPANAQPVYEILNDDMHRVKSRAPAAFKAHVNDMEKRLNILFDHLNNEDLLKPNTIEDMVELAQAIRSKNYDQAQAIHIDILTNRNSECGTWMTGVKRLINMSRATP